MGLTSYNRLMPDIELHTKYLLRMYFLYLRDRMDRNLYLSLDALATMWSICQRWPRYQPLLYEFSCDSSQPEQNDRYVPLNGFVAKLTAVVLLQDILLCVYIYSFLIVSQQCRSQTTIRHHIDVQRTAFKRVLLTRYCNLVSSL